MLPDSRTRERAAALAGRVATWLASGEVQSADGAFCAWRELDGALAFEYPEITGYALTWLAAQPELSEEALTAGVRAGDWLLGRLELGAIAAHDDFDGGAIYIFDLGMIAAGLMSFGRRIDADAFIARGEGVARRLASLVLVEEQPPAIDPSGPPSTREITWSNASRPHLSKCVQSLALAKQWDAARRLMAHASGFQRPDGYFLTQASEDHVMLHPHFYTVEAMWMWGTASQDRDCLQRARRATEWAWRHQLPSGGLPRLVDLAPGQHQPYVEQFDVTSQAVRAALLLDVRPEGLERAVQRLCEAAQDVDGAAALPYRSSSREIHLNAWVSMFGAQALQLAAHPAANRALEWYELV